MGSPWIVCDSTHGASLLAFQTFITIFTNPALEKPKRRDQAEKGSQWTKISAPKARDQTVEKEDSSKYEECDGSHIIDRLKIMEVR
jgi:hypothetical protein